MRKKKILVILTCIMGISLCGCQGNHKEENISTEETNEIGALTEEQDEKMEDEGDGIISTQLNLLEDYGSIEEKDFSFVNEFDETIYYYEMELLRWNEGAVPKPVISYLDKFYEEKEAEYQEYGEKLLEEDWLHRLAVENGDVEDESRSEMGPEAYNKLYFQYISYIGEDYISLVYYEVTNMGGARDYGTLEGITIDCKTGEEVTAAQVLGIENDEELCYEISDRMGAEQVFSWDELDYYITDKAIVFYGKEYWMTGNYEDVVIWR